MANQEQQIIAVVKLLSTQLISKNMAMVSVESCTGGGLGYYCTSQPGSSTWYAGGHITYHNTNKVKLGVPTQTLNNYGAVSEQTALAMAKAALNQIQIGEKLAANYCSLAITGIAGPDGGSKEKPIGTICFAWVTSATDGSTTTELFSGSRDSIRQQAILHSLTQMLRVIET